jgi:hypothetical protein
MFRSPGVFLNSVGFENHRLGLRLCLEQILSWRQEWVAVGMSQGHVPRHL